MRWLERLTALALAGAGSIHLVLIPEHFAEGALFGGAFVLMAGLQLSLAVVLLRGSGAFSRRLALGSSFAIAGLWGATRLVAPPTGSGPEEVDLWGVAATGLELSAVVLLLTALPSSGRVARRRLPWALAAALGFATLFLLASGSAGAASARPGSPLLDGYTLHGDFSITVPALVLLLDGGRLYLTLPWSTAAFLPLTAGLLAVQVYRAMGTVSCDRRLAARREGVLSALPALFAAPVCCGSPLLAFIGAGAAGSLSTLTPWLLGATAALLAVATWRTRPSLYARK